MPGLFEHTVSAICYEIGYSETPGECSARSSSYNDITVFVLQQWRQMPRFLAWPLRIATIGFACSGLARGGLFHRLSPHHRHLQVERWRHSSLGPCRDLIRFYRSLALLALWSRPGIAE